MDNKNNNEHDKLIVVETKLELLEEKVSVTQIQNDTKFENFHKSIEIQNGSINDIKIEILKTFNVLQNRIQKIVGVGIGVVAIIASIEPLLRFLIH